MASEDCWLYARFKTHEGYGRFSVRWPGGGRSSMTPYQAMYEHFVEVVPKGMVLDHLCDTPECVNPDHLQVTTQRNNVLRSLRTTAGINLRKTQCLRGHPFDEKNTYIRPSPPGTIWRMCRACRTINERKRIGFRNN